MQQTKEKEIKVLNLILLGLAGLCFLVAVITVVGNGFRAGTDDLFLVFTCLLLALLFAIPPLMWAKSQGILTNPFALGDEAEAPAHDHAHEAAHEHVSPTKETVIIWGGLLFLTAVEVFLGYIHIQPTLMLIVLMLLSVVKAALIVAYFMHLKFERLSLVLTIVPTLIVLFCLFAILFPDSNRLHKLRGPEPAIQAEHVEGAETEK
ncbi:MAG TPA: cytochrome C oxidase subunit IV family protein [Blastocatellia bacterium]|nr:cytochrome C oxidase subunit IV family protein [Blastocatellia bacterium]